MGKRRTHNEYVEEVAMKHPAIEVGGQFTNMRTKILHICKIDGHEWYPYPSSILHGYGCPECAKRAKTKTHSQYVSEASEVNPDVEVVGEYINSVTPILHRCNIDANEWMVAPGDILRGHGCPKCKNVYRKSTQEYQMELCAIHPYIRVIGEYVNKYTPIMHYCTVCGYEWNVRPNSTLANHSGCPNCTNNSRGENMIRNYLLAHSVEFVGQYKMSDCRDARPLPFDFYIPSLNTCIEYDGIQHFQPKEYFGGDEAFKKLKYHDSIKTAFCLNNDITLLRIRYDQDVNVVLSAFFKNMKQI